MFNFNLQNRAFEELNAEQFRFFYFLNNTLSMVNKTNNTPDNNTIEMFNGYMMDKLGFKERMVQYHIKALEQLGYITVVRPKGRNAKKQPNIITINDAINCVVSDENANDVKNNATNDAINYAIDCTLNKKEIKINKLNTRNINDSSRIVTEDKEKINKKESGNGNSLQSGTTENNTINVFNNSSSGDGESAQSSTVGNEDITSSGMEEENNPQPESSNNCAGRTLTPQVEEETTPHEKTQENAPQTSKNASFEKMTPQAAGNKPQNTKNNAPERAQNEQTPHGTDNSTSEGRIRNLRGNITLQLKLLEESCRMKKAPLFKARLKELKELLKGLERISPSEFNEAHEQWRLWHKEHKRFYPNGWDVDDEQQSRLAVEKLRYQDYISSIRLAKTFDDITAAVNKINNWSNRISSVFKPSDVEVLMNMSNDDFTRLLQTVPLFKDWVKWTENNTQKKPRP